MIFITQLLSRILCFFYILTPKILKLFFEKITLKVPISFKISKSGTYVVVLIVLNLHAKFERGNPIFDKAMAKNTQN